MPVRLVDATRFLRDLGIAQVRSFTVDDRRITAHLLSKAVHLGSGEAMPYVKDEDLFKRRPAISMWTRDDLIDSEALPGPSSRC